MPLDEGRGFGLIDEPGDYSKNRPREGGLMREFPKTILKTFKEDSAHARQELKHVGIRAAVS